MLFKRRFFFVPLNRDKSHNTFRTLELELKIVGFAFEQ